MSDLDLLQNFIATVEGAKAGGRRPEISVMEVERIVALMKYEIYTLGQRISQIRQTCGQHANAVKSFSGQETHNFTFTPKIGTYAGEKKRGQSYLPPPTHYFLEYTCSNQSAYDKAFERSHVPCFQLSGTHSQKSRHGRTEQQVNGPHTGDVRRRELGINPAATGTIQNYATYTNSLRVTLRNCLNCPNGAFRDKDQTSKQSIASLEPEIQKIQILIDRYEQAIQSLLLSFG
ncbi:hypothetical protein HOG17_05465 [Candidatus Peregrinibacteria bacterium]|jgi:hypothetical protein|nr:hypothetical protein [Candidatus Peregrinibacteria bacterium]MBT4148149.1 hypothetical protein [Candidatus Peregrinibacteria bacterium]MBT4366636.1 hypothetical protein [Candidatus Peregrinibacteria bacterium]MBT4455623.1 hypothetical protein [Candidatus Peregrinibacteria bacterium]